MGRKGELTNVTKISRLDRAARFVIAQALDVPFIAPVDIDPTLNHTKEMDAMLKQGYGFLVSVPHFSYRDFLDVGQALLVHSKEAKARRMLIPVAVHQLHQTGLEGIAAKAGIELAPIITEDSMEAAKKMHERNETPWWEAAKMEKDMQDAKYVETATKVIAQGGIVLFSPQMGRRDHIELPVREKGKPLHKPVAHLLFATKEIENVGIMAVGITMKGRRQDYSREKSGKWNLFRKYLISFGEPRTREDFLQRAHDAGQIPDIAMLLEMNDIAPKGYQIPQPSRRDTSATISS